jgi:hypothetical protein
LSRVQVIEHGCERRRVIVIDDFLPDPDAMVQAAAALAFEQSPTAYPGLRSPVEPAVSLPMWRRVAPLVQQAFGFVSELTRMTAYYSLITTPPEALRPIQRLPHFDGSGPFRIAMVHHLSRQPRGGTAFYRHRGTGFETIDEDRLTPYQAAVEHDLLRHGLPEAAYVAGDTPLYERIGHVQARFNRAIVYLGHALHSADVPQGTPLLPDPSAGRFSINTFAWAE